MSLDWGFGVALPFVGPDLPFVSCICPTIPSRRERLPKAMLSFMSQDYEGCTEMIIVAETQEHADSIYPIFEPCHPMRDGSQFGIIQATGTIGAKRNAGCLKAQGHIIVHFDDDDLSAPGRITDQVNRLLESGKAVTSYRNLKFTDGEKLWINRNWIGGYGTTLAYRRGWWLKHPFPDIGIGEDWEFVTEAMRANDYVMGDAKDFMMATIHPGNTAPRVIGEGWEEITTFAHGGEVAPGLPYLVGE